MKKLLAFVLSVLLVAGVLPLTAYTAHAAIVDSGECGDNLTWTLDDEGTLTIRGTGSMNDYSHTYDEYNDYYDDYNDYYNNGGNLE